MATESDYPNRPIERFVAHLEELGNPELLSVGYALLGAFEAASELGSKVPLPTDVLAVRRLFRALVDAEVAIGTSTREEAEFCWGKFEEEL